MVIRKKENIMSSRINYNKLSYWNYSNHHPSDRDEEKNAYDSSNGDRIISVSYKKFDKDGNVQWKKKEEIPFWAKKDKEEKRLDLPKKTPKPKQPKINNSNQNIPVSFYIDFSNSSMSELNEFFLKKEIFIDVDNKIKSCCNVKTPTVIFDMDEVVYTATAIRTKKKGFYTFSKRKEFDMQPLKNYYIFQKSFIEQNIPFYVICLKNRKLNKLAKKLVNNPVDLRKKF